MERIAVHHEGESPSIIPRLPVHFRETEQKSRGISQEYDGIAEIWWESEEDFIEAINSPEGRKLRTVFLDDEANFLDFGRSAAFFTEEHVLVGADG